MKEIGSDFFGAETVDDLPFAKDDEFVTTLIDGVKYVDDSGIVDVVEDCALLRTTMLLMMNMTTMHVDVGADVGDIDADIGVAVDVTLFIHVH